MMVITQKITSLAFEIHDGEWSAEGGRRDESNVGLNDLCHVVDFFFSSSFFFFFFLNSHSCSWLRQWISEAESEHKQRYVMGATTQRSWQLFLSALRRHCSLTQLPRYTHTNTHTNQTAPNNFVYCQVYMHQILLSSHLLFICSL